MSVRYLHPGRPRHPAVFFARDGRLAVDLAGPNPFAPTRIQAPVVATYARIANVRAHVAAADAVMKSCRTVA
jgi:hypothetical protein